MQRVSTFAGNAALPQHAPSLQPGNCGLQSPETISRAVAFHHQEYLRHPPHRAVAAAECAQQSVRRELPMANPGPACYGDPRGLQMMPIESNAAFMPFGQPQYYHDVRNVRAAPHPTGLPHPSPGPRFGPAFFGAGQGWEGHGHDFDSMPSHLGAMEQQPTYIGHIKSARDAILLLAACDLPAYASHPGQDARRGSYPPPRRVTRRLLDAERGDLVSSGCVFAWDEKEARMRRWTDGRVWSASRVSGCFLTYRELEARKKTSGSLHDGPTANQYKAEGLIKQSFSVTTASGRKLHVISYFTKRDVREGRLRRVSEDPRFVGEGGGEWNLKIDQREYAMRDNVTPGNEAVSSDASTPAIPNRDSQSSFSSSSQDEREVIEASPAGPQIAAAPSAPSPTSALPRKRSIDNIYAPQNAQNGASKLRRPDPRPIPQRRRSSSREGTHMQSASDFNQSSSSFGSRTSLNTSIPSASASDYNLSRDKHSLPKYDGPRQIEGRSTDATSPLLPRESALRGSASEMRATDSQESANAIGALLSLAGSAPRDGEVSIVKTSPASNNVTASPKSAGVSSVAQARPAPERYGSDRDALNMFKIRL